MNNITKFAIVIPNLNQSHFLPSALESLRYQSAPFNLAIMDGGSKDNFNEVINKYSDIITFLRSAPDKGQATAIKEGKEKVAGDIVAWLNADDYYFPNALDKVAACFEEDPDLDVVFGDAILVKPDGFFLSYFPPIQEFDQQKLTTNNFICQPACFVRRSAYERVGGVDPSLNFTMDWDLWCRLSLNGAKFRYISEILAAVRYYPGTKTLSGDKKQLREIYKIVKKYGSLRPRILLLFLGACYQRLSLKTEKTFGENLFYIWFGKLRKIKRRAYNVLGKQYTRTDLLYGFHRWESIVEGRCQIHIPWYDRRIWHRLRLKVEPNHGQYRVTLNGKQCKKIFYENGFLLAEVPELHMPYRQIDIECVDRQQWKLLEFTCDLK